MSQPVPDTAVITATPKAHWYILGAGAIGCLWAASFARAGFRVTLITRNTVPSQEINLILNDVSGPKTLRYTVEFLTVAEFLAEKRSAEYLLISTKAQQTLAALNALHGGLTATTQIVVMQNGLEAKQVARNYPSNTVFAGVTTDGAYKESATTVVFAGKGKTFIGRYQPEVNSSEANNTSVEQGHEPPDNMCTALTKQLPHEFLNIECCHDIEVKQWQKLAVNCACNALTAIYRCRNGELLSNSQALETMKRLCEEVIAVTTALGLPKALLADSFERTLTTLQITANNFSSMYKDIDAHRSTEIDAINGYLCTEASRLNIACPANQAMVNAIKQLEQNK